MKIKLKLMIYRLYPKISHLTDSVTQDNSNCYMPHLYDDLDKMNQFLEDGKVVLCPTDTIWGLSCDALNKSAVDKVFRIKERDPSKKLILLVSSIEQLKNYVHSIHPRIETLIHFCNRPLTIIYKGGKNLKDYLLSDDGTIAVRVIKEGYMNELITKFGKPVVSTSANIQGEPGPGKFSDISDTLKNRVDYISTFGRNGRSSGKPSVIIKYNREGELIFLR